MLLKEQIRIAIDGNNINEKYIKKCIRIFNKLIKSGYKEIKEKLDSSMDLVVATKYPNVAKEYFYTKKKQTIEIIKLNGSVELAPIVNLSDVIVDIVETGSTLKANGLEVLADICPVSARVVVNRVSMKLEYERISKIIKGLKELVVD